MSLARVPVVAYAVCVWGLVMAPAVVVQAAGTRGGGAGVVGNVDLLCAAAAVGTASAVLAWRRLGATEDEAPGSRWIAALSALVVLAVAATALPALALHLFAGVPAGPGRAVVLWGTALTGAVLCAEVARRRLLRWLTPVDRRSG